MSITDMKPLEDSSLPPVDVILVRDSNSSLPPLSTASSTTSSVASSMKDDDEVVEDSSKRISSTRPYMYPTINLSPDRPALPLPSSTGGFSLQPRRNVPNLTRPSPARHTSSLRNNNGGRGRKRCSQSLASSPRCSQSLASSPSLSSYYSTVPPRVLFSPVNCASDRSNFNALPPRHLSQFESLTTSIASPIPIHHAMQSMSIRSPCSPAMQTPGRRGDSRESSSFVLLSPPSSKTFSSYRPRMRSESFTSLDSSSTQQRKTITSVKGVNHQMEEGKKTPAKAAIGGSSAFTPSTPGSMMKIGERGNNNDSMLLSTPHSQKTAKTCYTTPGTPASVRTLPSPYNTPLPRSMRLTPRRTNQRCLDQGSVSSETTMFLSPNDNSQKDSSSRRNDGGIIGDNIFSFEGAGGIGSLHKKKKRQPTISRPSSYMPSPFSCSRSSRTPRSRMDRTPPADSRNLGRSLRVETRSLLGTQDDSNNTTLDFMAAANARAAALDCDDVGSLTDDDSDVSFLLTNPVILAQERDTVSMPPPRPSRRRRMSPPVADEEDKNTSNSGVDEDNLKELTMDDINEDDSSCPQKVTDLKKSIGNYDRKYFDWLKSVKSYTSMDGLDLGSSSSSPNDSSKGRKSGTSPLDVNIKPYTLPMMKDDSVISPLPSTPSPNSSVRISRSDADNVHLTIAKMAAAHNHEHCSPGLMTCRS
jgi:hypothetical protein